MVKISSKQEEGRDVPNAKLLSIDYDLYTDGDQEFKLELIELMISNLKELQWSLGSTNDVFKKVCHKVKATLSILNCSILNTMVEDVNNASQDDRNAKCNLFSALCDDIIKHLNEESH